MFGAITGNSAGQDFPSLSNVALQVPDVLVFDMHYLINAEVADLAPSSKSFLHRDPFPVFMLPCT